VSLLDAGSDPHVLERVGIGPAFLAIGLGLLPVIRALAARFAPAEEAWDDEGVHWGVRDGLVLLLIGGPAIFLVGLVPGEGVSLDLQRTALLFAIVGAAVLMIATQRGFAGLRALGLSGRRTRRSSFFGVLSYALFAPLLWGVLALWPLLAEELGLELEEQAVLTGILSIEGDELLVASILAVVVIPFFEELLFRGFLQGFLVRLLGGFAGVVVTSLAFALLHGLSATPPIFCLSLFLGWLQLRTGRLAAPWAAHACHNGLTLAYFLSG
jgi:membrane protease YdiL (CAAX protease family)